ncbi:MAG: SMP-30/gluconolactonase/LRE family protein [Anaerolineales bacterium]
MPEPQPELLLDARATLGEGPAWHARRKQLLWLDIEQKQIHFYNPKSGEDSTLTLGIRPGCLVPAPGGDLLLGVEHGFARLRLPPAADGLLPAENFTWLAQPESHLPDNRFNDGKCSPEGRFLAGSMDTHEENPCGALYSLSPDGVLQTLKSGLTISNGLTWSADGRTLYHIDTPTRQIVAHEYDPASGEIGAARVVVRVPAALGWPDGMTSDSRGNLWVGMWGGAALSVWNPTSGELLESIPLPAKNVTSCAFGGDSLNELYITSARRGLSAADLAAYPLSGGLFRLKTRLAGAPTWEFGAA